MHNSKIVYTLAEQFTDMKKAIEFLRSKNIEVTDKGKILSELPTGEEGISLKETLEDITEYCGYCITIIGDQLQAIQI